MRKQRRVFAVHQIQAGMIEPDAPYIEGGTRYFPLQLQDSLLLWERTQFLLALHEADFRRA